jgi:hypothetical protein
MRLLSKPSSVGIAVALLSGLLWAERSLAQVPIPKAFATPQGTTSPPLPGAPGGPSGQPQAGAAGSPAGAGTAASRLGLESSAFGPNASTISDAGGPSGLFGPGGTEAGAGGGGFAPGLSGFAGASGAPPGIIGDQSPFLSLRAAPALPRVPSPPPPFPPKPPPTPPSPRSATALAPSVRGFKIADNQSPQPQDRVFYTFNYFYNLNSATDKRFDTPINNLRAYREIFGFEKTFDQGRASFGMVLPLDTLSATSTIQGNFAKPGGTSTSLGDLSIFTKVILRLDPKTGSLFSGGLVVTAPTGPSTFAGAKYISAIHTTQIQPYIGYILRRGKFYLHGFSAFAVPLNPNDVSLYYNDVGLGYFLYQDTNEVAQGWITAIVPTTEVHVNTPLNHQNVYNPNDIAGSANVVNLTQGLNIEFNRRSILTFGIATPVTSPKPFDLEALILFNVRFGGSRRTLPPILGG